MISGPEAGIIGVQRLALSPHPSARVVLSRAVQQGICWVDCSDIWGRAVGDAERMLGQIRADVPELQIALRGGFIREGDAVRADGRPDRVIAACEASCRRLGLERIGLYQLQGVDPRRAWSEQIHTLARMRAMGLVEAVGLCNVRVGELRQALDVLPIASVTVELSPLHPHAARTGVIEAARDRGLRVFGCRPFGGVQGMRRLQRDPELDEIARAMGAPIPEIVLAWLRELGILPICGPTSASSIDAIARSRALALDPEIRARLDDRFEAGRILRQPPSRPRPALDETRRVVMIMGRPGAGKTSRTLRDLGEAVEQRTSRLNRDTRGGTLGDLLPALEDALKSGVAQVFLDNTYASRASRRPVIELGRAHGVPVHCLWMTTSEDDAEVNIVERILDILGRLPDPAEFESLNRRHPGIIPPRAASRYRQDFEAPSLDEGFASIEAVPFVRRFDPKRSARALVLDPSALVPDHRALIGQHVEQGFLPIVIGWQPADTENERKDVLDRIHRRGAALGFAIRAWLCPHPEGPFVCWCRKPLPGLLIAALRETGCDPRSSVMLARVPADRTLARKLRLAVIGV